MTFVLIIVLTFVAFFLIKRSVKQSKQTESAIKVEYGIPSTKAELEVEQQSNEEVMKLLEASIVASGYFRTEKIPELIAILRSGSIPYGRTNTKVAVDGDSLLNLEEKRALGLNTRMKYSKKFIGYFNPSAFKTIEPKATLECMHLDAYHRVCRKKQLLSFKKLGFVKQVKIVPVGDFLDCKRIKRRKKVYNIDEVPELPLPGCDADFCRCAYEAIIPKDL